MMPLNAMLESSSTFDSTDDDLKMTSATTTAPRSRRRHRLQKSISSLEEILPETAPLSPTRKGKKRNNGVTLYAQTKDLAAPEREALFGAIVNPNTAASRVGELIFETLNNSSSGSDCSSFFSNDNDDEC